MAYSSTRSRWQESSEASASSVRNSCLNSALERRTVTGSSSTSSSGEQRVKLTWYQTPAQHADDAGDTSTIGGSASRNTFDAATPSAGRSGRTIGPSRKAEFDRERTTRWIVAALPSAARTTPSASTNERERSDLILCSGSWGGAGSWGAGCCGRSREGHGPGHGATVLEPRTTLIIFYFICKINSKMLSQEDEDQVDSSSWSWRQLKTLRLRRFRRSRYEQRA